MTARKHVVTGGGGVEGSVGVRLRGEDGARRGQGQAQWGVGVPRKSKEVLGVSRKV